MKFINCAFLTVDFSNSDLTDSSFEGCLFAEGKLVTLRNALTDGAKVDGNDLKTLSNLLSRQALNGFMHAWS